jgi:hypothetical protein
MEDIGSLQKVSLICWYGLKKLEKSMEQLKTDFSEMNPYWRMFRPYRHLGNKW